MLVTSGCWFSGVGDRISILVTSFEDRGCWCQTLMPKDRGCCIRHQHRPSRWEAPGSIERIFNGASCHRHEKMSMTESIVSP